MAASRYGGRRISVTGLPGNDIEINGKEYEVKLVVELSALLRKWLAQAERQKAAGVLFKEDSGRWYLIVEADDHFGVQL